MSTETVEPFYKALGRYLVRLLVTEGVIFSAALIITFITQGTARDYSTTLFSVGAIVIIYSALNVNALQSIDRSFRNQFAGSVGVKGIGGNARQLFNNSEAMFGRSMHFFIIGIIPIVASLIVLHLVNNVWK